MKVLQKILKQIVMEQLHLNSFQYNIPDEYTSLQDFFLHYHERDVSNSSYSNFPIEPTIKTNIPASIAPKVQSTNRISYYEREWENKVKPEDLEKPDQL